MNRALFKPHLQETFPKKDEKQYAVGIFINFEKTVPEVYFIERARFDGDYWSGDIAFPGGKKERDDAHILETAIRESEEEIGVDIDKNQHLLGFHKSISLKKRGRLIPGDLNSFVFEWASTFQPKLSEEVEDLFSLDLNYICDPNNLSNKIIRRENIEIQVPGIIYQEHLIWGLTYSLLVDLLKKVKPDLRLPVY